MQPIIILSDCENEASLVSLVFQKAQRSFVSIALNEKDSKTDFPKLLDILLSNDYQTPKNSIKPLRGLLGGWTWWRSWKQRSDTNTSSSDYYKSASAEEEKVILVAPSRKEDASFIEDSHSKKYFEAIHNCLDGIMAEIDRASIGTQIATQLITIVNSLLYTHLVKVLSASEIGQDFAEIEALHLAVKTEESSGRSEALRGTYMMILTRKNMLLVTAGVVEVGKVEGSNNLEELDQENENEDEVERKDVENTEDGKEVEKEERKEDEMEKEDEKKDEIENEKEIEHESDTEIQKEIADESKLEAEKEEMEEEKKEKENTVAEESENTATESCEKEIETTTNEETESMDTTTEDCEMENTTTSEEKSMENNESEDCAVETAKSEESKSESVETESAESPEENETNESSDIPTESTTEQENPAPADSSETSKSAKFMESTDIIPSQQSASLEDEVGAAEDSLDVDEQREMEIVSRIVESLERFGSCSVDEAKEVDWNHCDSYVVKGVIPLQEVQNVNILVSEENGENTSTSPQIIHIRYGSKGELYLQVDYAIFVVNEIMNRIGTFL